MSKISTKLSAYAFILELFDFNATSLAPPSTKVVVHKKTKQQGIWAYHGVNGWYIGQSIEHYQCVKCHMPAIQKDINVDMITSSNIILIFQ